MTGVSFSIQQAVRAIAARCDGARDQDGMGFNGRDTSFGKSLAAIPHDDWSPRQLECAYQMLRTYRTQLLSCGIDYDLLKAPAAELEVIRERRAAKTVQQAPAKPESGQAKLVRRDVEKNRWVASFPYDGALIGFLKSSGLRAFKQDEGWFWPFYEEQAWAVLPKLVELGFDGAIDAVATLAEAEVAKKTLRDASGAIQASRDVSLTSVKGFKTRGYQEAGVEYILNVRRVLNGDQMGLGKTIQGIAAAVHVAKYPAAIVMPAGLKLNWKKEFAEWAPDLMVEVLSGLNDRASGVAQVYLVNYDVLKGDDLFQVGDEWLTKAQLEERGLHWKGRKKQHKLRGTAASLKALGLQQIYFDEFHYAKHRDSQRSKACEALAEGVEIRVGFTGTPVENRPKELVHQLQILGRLEEFGGFKKFTQRYCAGHQTPWGYNADGASNLDELHNRLRETCFIRRLKEQVLAELPPKVWSRIPIELTNRAEYDRAEADFLDWMLENEGKEAADRAGRAEELTRLAKLEALAAKGKLAGIKSWVEGFLEAGEKLVLFAHHIEVQDKLLEAFDNAVAIQGSVSKEKTEAAKSAFNTDARVNLMVASLKAGGVGHTLHANGKCSNVALCEFPWTPAAQEQAEDRIHRIGQVAESVNVYELYAPGTVDEEKLALLDAKRAIVDQVTDGAQRERLKVESVEDALIERMRAKAREARKGRAA